MLRLQTLPLPTFALLLAAASLVSCGQAANAAADTERIRELIQRAEATNNAGDVDGWVALFEDGAVYMPPGQPAVTTREGLRDIATAGFTAWRSQISIAPDEIVPSGDWAFARSRVTGTATPVNGGEPVDVDLKQIVIYHRQPDGSWKIARLIGNGNG